MRSVAMLALAQFLVAVPIEATARRMAAATTQAWLLFRRRTAAASR